MENVQGGQGGGVSGYQPSVSIIQQHSTSIHQMLSPFHTIHIDESLHPSQRAMLLEGSDHVLFAPPSPHSSQEPAHSRCSISTKRLKMVVLVGFLRPSCQGCSPPKQPVRHAGSSLPSRMETPLSTHPTHCSPAMMTSRPTRDQANGCAQKHLYITYRVLDTEISK